MFRNKDYIFILTKYASRGVNFLVVFLITFLIEENIAAQWTLDWSVFRVLFPMFTFGQEIIYFSSEKKENRLNHLFFFIILSLTLSIVLFLFLDFRYYIIVIANIFLGYIRLNGMLIRNENISNSVILEDLLPATLLIISIFSYIYLDIEYFTSISILGGVTSILVSLRKKFLQNLKNSNIKFFKYFDGFYPIIFSGMFALMGYFNRFFIENQLGPQATIEYQILFQTFLIIPIFINGVNTIQSKNFNKSSWLKEYKRFNQSITAVCVGTIILINTLVFKILDLLKPDYFDSYNFIIFSVFTLLTAPLYASMIFVQLLKLNLKMIPITILIILTQILLFSNFELNLQWFIIFHGVGTFLFYLSCNIIINAPSREILRIFWTNKIVIGTLIYLLISFFFPIWVELLFLLILLIFIVSKYK